MLTHFIDKRLQQHKYTSFIRKKGNGKEVLIKHVIRLPQAHDVLLPQEPCNQQLNSRYRVSSLEIRFVFVNTPT